MWKENRWGQLTFRPEFSIHLSDWTDNLQMAGNFTLTISNSYGADARLDFQMKMMYGDMPNLFLSGDIAFNNRRDRFTADFEIDLFANPFNGNMIGSYVQVCSHY